MNIYIIYRAHNIVNNKNYIGFTSSLKTRKYHHRRNADKKINRKFYDAINKYGWNNFQWEILYCSIDREHCLNQMEQHFIDEYDSIRNGYNMCNGGGTPVIYPSEQTRLKMSFSHIGLKQNPETIDKKRKERIDYYLSTGQRIIKTCPICFKEFHTQLHCEKITCGRSCASSLRNFNRSKQKNQ